VPKAQNADAQDPDSRVPEVDVAEGKRRVEAGAVLLDVREPHEWDAGHAEAALSIPMGELGARLDEIPPGRDVVVICRSGSRSGRVTEALVHAGHDAVNLAGGMQAWASAGLPVVAEHGGPGAVA
jgi:rhodanese-related sulfurtransferase